MSIQAKLIAMLLLVLALVGSHWYVYGRGVRNGSFAERTIWQAKEAKRKDDEAQAIAANAEANRLIQKANDAKNLEDGLKHEAALAKVNEQLRIMRTAVAHAGGLRVSDAICHQARPAAKTGGDSGLADPLAGTVELPQQLEDALWAEAERAEQLNTYAHACQDRLKEELQEPQ